MMKKLLATALLAATAALTAAPSWAGSGFSFYYSDYDRGYRGHHGHGHGHRHHHHNRHDRGYRSGGYMSYSYAAPPPVYYAPAPTYYAPAPVYYAPAPAYYVPPQPAYNRLVLGWR